MTGRSPWLMACICLLLAAPCLRGVEADPPAAVAAWAEAQAVTDPVARRAAELRAARAGSLPAMERLLVTGRFQEIGLIDVRRAPFADWAARQAVGAITPSQVHGLALANWVFRNQPRAGRLAPALMGEARRDLERDPVTHPLVAIELSWHLASFEPKDAPAARTWFDRARAMHDADAGGDPWVGFCQLVDIATVAVNNGYEDVAAGLVERVEREAAGIADPYAAGMAASLRAFLQVAAWGGKVDLAAAARSSAAAAAAFAKAQAPVMQACALDGQAKACQALAADDPPRAGEAMRVLAECAAIHAREGATTWQALTLMERAGVAQQMLGDRTQAAADLREAMRLATAPDEQLIRLAAGQQLITLLLGMDRVAHREEVIGLASDGIAIARRLGDADAVRRLETLRTRLQDAVRKQ